jgi:hypothetical protein
VAYLAHLEASLTHKMTPRETVGRMFEKIQALVTPNRKPTVVLSEDLDMDLIQKKNVSKMIEEERVRMEPAFARPPELPHGFRLGYALRDRRHNQTFSSSPWVFASHLFVDGLPDFNRPPSSTYRHSQMYPLKVWTK